MSKYEGKLAILVKTRGLDPYVSVDSDNSVLLFDSEEDLEQYIEDGYVGICYDETMFYVVEVKKRLKLVSPIQTVGEDEE